MKVDDVERDEFIKNIEYAIEETSKKMESAIRQDNMAQFAIACETWRQSQLLWLQATQEMSPEKAQTVMIGFAVAGKLDRWVEERCPGPPPSILSSYKL